MGTEFFIIQQLYFHLVQNIKFLLRLLLLSECYLEVCLFNLQIFGDFLAIILLLVSSLIPFGSESILCMISVLLVLRYMLRLWLSMWSW